MSNATAKVSLGAVRRHDEFLKRHVETLAADTRFYIHAMIGVDATGYYCKGDDTQSWLFAGIVRGDQGDPKILAGTAGDTGRELDIHQPFRFQLAIASVAVADIGKKVYALFDNEGTLDASATTYANLIGQVVLVAGTGVALVEPFYDGVAANARAGAAKILAATGNQTLTKADLNKTVFCGNTAGLSVILPAVAQTQAGDRLTFVKTSADAAAITLDGNASETIDGATTLATLDAAYDTATLVSTGTGWIVLNRDIAP